MNKKIKLAGALLVSIVTASLMSCSSSSDASNGGGPKPPTPPSPTSLQLQLGNIGVIPTNEPIIGNSYPLMVLNNTNKVMNIDSVTATGIDSEISKSVANDSQLFDWSACKKIQPFGSCSVQIKNGALIDKNGGADGQYAINFKAHAEGSSNVIEKTQVIGYQNFALSNNTGVYYNSSSATVTNATNVKGSMAVTIPVYFKDAYNTVSVVSPDVSANLVGCGLPNADGVYKISANTSCSLVMNYQGGKAFNANVKLVDGVVTQKASKKATKNKTTKDKSLQSMGVLLNLNIVNAIYAQGLLNATVTSSYLPTDNSTQLVISYTNIGSGPAVINNAGWYYDGDFYAYSTTPQLLSGTTNTNVIGINNTCTQGSSIAAGNGCQITFKMSGDEDAGDLLTTVKYNTGISTNTAMAMYNVYFSAPNAQANLTSTITGALTGNVIGQTLTATVLVQNTSTTTPISITKIPSLVALGNPVKPSSITITNNTCTVNAQLLSGGNTCSYTVSYVPTESTLGVINNLYGTVTGTYAATGGGGQTITVTGASNLPYSATNDSTFISINPNAAQMVVPVGQTLNQDVVITNTGTTNTQVSNITFDTTAAFPAGATISNNTCTGVTLLDGEDCTITVTYAPTAVTSIESEVQVNFTYDNGVDPAFATKDILYTNFQATAGAVNMTLFSVTGSDNNLPSGAPIHTGDGLTSGTQFNFYNYGNSLKITLTYKNTGTASASNLNIDANSLPVSSMGYTVVNNCNGVTLAAGATCTVELTAISSSISSGLSGTNSLNFNIPNVIYTEAGVTYLRNTFTTPSGGSPKVWATSQAVISPSVNVLSPSTIVQYGSNSFYVFPVKFANTATTAQPVQIPLYAPVPSVAAPYGYSSSITTPPTPTAGVANVSLAGGESVVKYLWVPATSSVSPSFGYLQYWINYNSNAYVVNQLQIASQMPYVGVTYSASGSTISGSWNNLGNLYSSASTVSLTTATASASVQQLIQYRGNLFALSASGIDSWSITPWIATTSGANTTYNPDPDTAGAGANATGDLTAVGTYANTYTPISMAFGYVGGVEYAAVAQAAESNLYLYTVSGGALTVTGGSPYALSNSSGGAAISPIFSTAIGGDGTIYVTGVGNTLYTCGTVTAPNASCTSVSFTAFPSLNLNGVNVAVNNGYITLTPSYALPTTSNAAPSWSQLYSVDNSSALSFGTISGSTNLQYSNAVPFNANYNLVAGTLNDISGAYGAYTAWQGGTSYSYLPNASIWDLATPTQLFNLTAGNLPTAPSAGAIAPMAYYSFMPVSGQY